jgi:uncharacterized protein (DUF433 family)
MHRDQHVGHATGSEVVEHFHPEFGALCGLDPQTQGPHHAEGHARPSGTRFAAHAIAQRMLTWGAASRTDMLLFPSMNTVELLARIAPEAGKMGAKPVIRGRRITPSMVLNMLANGASREAVLEAYPVLEPEDIDACLLYAARLSEVAAAEGLTIAAE